jgi:hypothetical protein
VEWVDDASTSFFAFFGQDGIFMARDLEDLAVLRAGATSAQTSL